MVRRLFVALIVSWKSIIAVPTVFTVADTIQSGSPFVEPAPPVTSVNPRRKDHEETDSS
jgi:hypothetical protein